ncbi:hypothetical protein B9Z19DRAFT_363029 [Tuber borchii]|uniref:Uncharacterized protein n=1 Tax=Tuber borchii TaxID=42251 RepID=A0A2T7A4J1_TUBBO|nr:hypothetical protein B9Z19DRAFT_363029 [Tuber borchii]
MIFHQAQPIPFPLISIIYVVPRASTRASTPHSASFLHPLVLNHKPQEDNLIIQTSLHYHPAKLPLLFASQLLSPIDEFPLMGSHFRPRSYRSAVGV